MASKVSAECCIIVVVTHIKLLIKAWSPEWYRYLWIPEVTITILDTSIYAGLKKTKKNGATKTVYAINRFTAEYWKRCLTPPSQCLTQCSHPLNDAPCPSSEGDFIGNQHTNHECVFEIPFSNLELHLATSWVFIRYKIWGLFKRVCLAIKCHYHDDVIKRKYFPRYWPFVRGIQRSSVNSPHM